MRVLACLVMLTACGGSGLAVDPVEFSGPPGSLAPSLVSDGDRAILSWTEPAGPGHRVRVAVRDGDGWSDPRTVVENDRLFVNWADFPSVAVFPDGRWLAHWLERSGTGTYAYHVMMAVSDDRGATWSAPFRPHGDRSDTEHGFASMAPLEDGLGAIWLDGRQSVTDSVMTLRFTTIGPDGTPAPDIEIDGRACDCCQTAMVATASGLVAAYRDRSAGEIRDIAVTRLTDSGWTGPVTVHDDGWVYRGCPVNGPQLAAHGDTVAVAWFTNAGDTARVRVALSTDGGAAFGAPVTVNDARPLGRVAAAWLPEGGAAVAWLETGSTDSTAALRLRRIRPSGAVHAAVTVAETEASRRVGFPRLAAVPGGVLAAWRGPGDTGGVQARFVRVHD